MAVEEEVSKRSGGIELSRDCVPVQFHQRHRRQLRGC
jgi:hypothetical protein